jgi:protein phosphatase
VLDDTRLADILGTGTVDYAVVELVRAALDAGSSDNITCVVADVVPADAPAADDATSAAASTGPMMVGAAAEQPRKAGATSKSFFRGHRGGDTGELEPVPGAPESDRPVDPEELRYAPRPPRRFVWLRRIGVLLALTALLALAATGAYSWTQSQYYVAADGEYVAIYQGIQADLPGLTLSDLHETSEITLASLPDYRAAQVRQGISADDLEDARTTVRHIGDLARPCPTPEPTPTASPTASPSAGGAKQSDRPRASASPSPSPSPSPTLAPPDCVEVSP